MRSCQQVRQCCLGGDWVLLEGERGSGRARLAQAVGQDVKQGRTIRVMRAETFASAARFVAELAAESGDDDFALVIADVDDIDADMIEPIASMLAARQGRGWIAATGSMDYGELTRVNETRWAADYRWLRRKGYQPNQIVWPVISPAGTWR